MRADRTSELQAILKNAQTFVWLHEECARLYERWNKYITNFVSASTFLIDSIGIAFVTANVRAGLIIAFKVLNICTGIPGALWNTDKYNSLIADHRFLIGKNHALASRVREELWHREIGREQYGSVLQAENEITQNTATHNIHPKIWGKYQRIFGTDALAYVELYRIGIFSDTPDLLAREQGNSSEDSLGKISIIVDRETASV